MSARHRAMTLGILFGGLVPALAGAQGRIARPSPPGQIAVTLAPPPAGSARGNLSGGYRPGRMNHTGAPHVPDHRFGRAWPIPLIVTSTYESRSPAPAPYPVPYYYPVPVSAAAVSAPSKPEKPAPPSYDPTKSRTLIIGAGADGGGGVMRIVRPTSELLRITWLGTTRPIRQATLFLADDARQPLKSRTIDLAHREVLFSLATFDRPVAYAGLTVDLADGSKQTTLVPLAESGR